MGSPGGGADAAAATEQVMNFGPLHAPCQHAGPACDGNTTPPGNARPRRPSVPHATAAAHQLAVAAEGGAQQHGYGLAVQHALRAEQARKQRVADGQPASPLFGGGARVVV